MKFLCILSNAAAAMTTILLFFYWAKIDVIAVELNANTK